MHWHGLGVTSPGERNSPPRSLLSYFYLGNLASELTEESVMDSWGKDLKEAHTECPTCNPYRHALREKRRNGNWNPIFPMTASPFSHALITFSDEGKVLCQPH